MPSLRCLATRNTPSTSALRLAALLGLGLAGILAQPLTVRADTPERTITINADGSVTVFDPSAGPVILGWSSDEPTVNRTVEAAQHERALCLQQFAADFWSSRQGCAAPQPNALR